MTEPIEQSAVGLDLSPRIVASTTVVASPADATETIIASVAIDDDLTLTSGVVLLCFAAFTVGTNGVSAQVKVRQTDVNGTAVADSGAITETAADLDTVTVLGFDDAPAAGQVYKATLTVASGSAASAVSAVTLLAIAV